MEPTKLEHCAKCRVPEHCDRTGECCAWTHRTGTACREAEAKPTTVKQSPSAAQLPSDSASRKRIPIARGLLDYFPLACAAIAECSYLATQQHHPGKEMHWDRSKSTDHADCLVRHLMQRGTIDTDGVRHMTKAAWRALAALQLELEAQST